MNCLKKIEACIAAAWSNAFSLHTCVHVEQAVFSLAVNNSPLGSRYVVCVVCVCVCVRVHVCVCLCVLCVLCVHLCGT